VAESRMIHSLNEGIFCGDGELVNLFAVITHYYFELVIFNYLDKCK